MPKTTDKTLAEVGHPPKPKPKKRTINPKGTGNLPPKKRSSAKHNRTRSVNKKTTLTHITDAIVREGGTVPDIGVILGCESSEGSSEWLERLKAEGLSLMEFLEVAKQRADIELIRVAVKAALGYSYEEEKQELTPEVDELGQPTGKHVPGKRTVTTKRERDSGLHKFLLTSRMPEYFTNTKHIKIDKRTVEVKIDAENEIRSFTSGLLKALGGETIDAEFVEETD